MEDYAVDIVIGKGPSARTMRIKLPKFTLVGATTRLALLTGPLRDRFGAVLRLDFYENAAMEEIIRRSATILEIEVDDAGAAAIAIPIPGHAARCQSSAEAGAGLCRSTRQRSRSRRRMPRTRWRCSRSTDWVSTT